MLIAYYHHPRSFPGGSSPKPHSGVFSRFDWNHQTIIYVKQDGEEWLTTWGKSWFWPALVGLDRIRYPVMAHFALFTGKVGPGGHYYSPRVWFQITTRPINWQAMEVEVLWQPEPPLDDAYKQLMNGSVSAAIHTAEFWVEFFTQKLLAKRAAVESDYRSAIRKVERMKHILTSIPI